MWPRNWGRNMSEKCLALWKHCGLLVAPKLGEGKDCKLRQLHSGPQFPSNPFSGFFGLPIADKAACVHK